MDILCCALALLGGVIGAGFASGREIVRFFAAHGAMGFIAVAFALAALLAYLGGYRDRRIVRTVAGFPFFMAAWLPLQLVSLVSRTRSWQPIAHTRAVRAESLRGAGFLTTI